ncbi:hypothetical protein LUZ61_012448 [Rhynchospora tenuis]|uniref:DYW domain-containing protein n=1 Tax=Rhynchospora tenuis TaxID=198213 RepID=A0AAD6A3C9_9POAL|nr:hypothetical protein LUZ61_012448 [Rhynchospora tenuis]
MLLNIRLKTLLSQFRFYSTSPFLLRDTPSLSHFQQLLNQCKSLSDSLSILERLSAVPVQFWNALIRNEVKHGRHDRALVVCRQALRAGAKPDNYTLPLALKACGELASFLRGSSVHGVVVKHGFESNVFVGNGLIVMYARCGAVEEARKVFDEMCQRGIDDVVSWNSIIAAYVKDGDARTALNLFSELQGAFRPDVISLVNILPACASLKALRQAREIHGYAIRTGLLENIFVGNSLIDVYAKCGTMRVACKVFESMERRDTVSFNAMVTGFSQNGMFDEALGALNRMREENIPIDVVSWSAVISSYAQRGLGSEAISVFRQMQLSQSVPNEVTIISLLSAIASAGALSHGMETHAYCIRKSINGEDFMVKNALIDMYAKCGSFGRARCLFDSIPGMNRNVVTWTVMIGGYAQLGDAIQALELFSVMVSKPYFVKPNAHTVSCALMACARLSSIHFGKQVHAHIARHSYGFAALHVDNCILDMYVKCGDVKAAQNVFDKMPLRNDVTWTSILTGYGMLGRGEETLKLFDDMQKAGVKPDDITFLVVLYACCHAGLVDVGLKYFESMSKVYGVTPRAVHYACVVDLLGRTGQLDKAWMTICNMPLEPTPMVWIALLSVCRIHKNVNLAELALEKLVEAGSDSDSSYTLLSNIYANAGRWKDAAQIRTKMKKSGIIKQPGCSWVESKTGITTFLVGDKSHPRSKEIYELLQRLMDRIKGIGYVPQVDFALHDVDEEEKSSLLSEHSEKLALAYGLLTAPKGSTIRVMKNLRVCGDCHSAILYISKVVEHDIILRDSSRFHHFRKGVCSCGGYW